MDGSIWWQVFPKIFLLVTIFLWWVMWKSSFKECDNLWRVNNLNSESWPVVYSLLATNSAPIVDDKSTAWRHCFSSSSSTFLHHSQTHHHNQHLFMMTGVHHEVHTFHVHQVQHLSSPFSQQLSKSDYRQSSRRTWRKRKRTKNAAKTRWEKMIMKIVKWEYEIIIQPCFLKAIIQLFE